MDDEPIIISPKENAPIVLEALRVGQQVFKEFNGRLPSLTTTAERIVYLKIVDLLITVSK